jgi:UDP-N-acetylglucosamine 2-epimerase (hydrolysing)
LDKKKILFLTGTRADFGKLKSLIQISKNSGKFEVSIFATGMHMHHKYGYTLKEIEKSGFDNIYKFINYTSETTMDLTLAKTIEGLSSYCQEEKPDLIIVHGDRLEALAGAIVGSMNNILVAHIEGGEVSGTIDELIRHSVSKLSHVHFVSNTIAKNRLIKMGENGDWIFEIGSPDIDLMKSNNLPKLEAVLKYYNIEFSKFAILMFHPVTSEAALMEQAAQNIVDALKKSNLNYIVIYPNNDLGSGHILRIFEQLENNDKFKIFPSLRFEYFLTLLKNAQFIIGNSSAGIREAPHFGVPTINIGSRQQNRSLNDEIIQSTYEIESIENSIDLALDMESYKPVELFGDGNSAEKFYKIISDENFWKLSTQKIFID